MDVKKTALLAVSFGTSFHDSREATIGAIEAALQRAFPDMPVRRAFTSKIIKKKLMERDGIHVDNVQEAMTRLREEGYTQVVVQPTHFMSGIEYDRLVEDLKPFQSQFEALELGTPLLTDDEDFLAVADAITADEDTWDECTAHVFMGHGTEHGANNAYTKLQQVLDDNDHYDIYIGTVEAEPGIEDVIQDMDGYIYTHVILQPLMVVAGDHANNDMAGEDEDSWKSLLEAEGYLVECKLDGLGANPDIQAIYVKHAKAAMERM